MTSLKQNAIELLTRPDIPSGMRKQIEEMKGYHLHLVIQKQLEDIDINKKEGRLCLPLNNLLFDFTNHKERELFNNNNNNGINKMERIMEVKILDEAQRETSILLNKSIIGNQYYFSLMGGWNSFVDTNFLRTGNIIQLWSFRRERLIPSNRTFVSDLYFALNKVDHRICL